ncbi:pyridoxamine 5'-phosphate oxidase family protein [Belliella pelovolcani]|uniref:Pyridoxine/pyridoxamine 5'-phosphate oxidase n=1 Tax=Belliella pelovolcani TaxID=529505 RepID=A0A1N7PCI9_9BACT|nr:pyridoxamine 5'-phosphate oxidase family protein [Belliella pelovolcani]SIT08301.1 Pyridoxine/pyridoxamine 5'-phosphate oxidase [Belliella pelovolcani]
MLFDIHTKQEDVLLSVKHEIKRGALDAKHAFRFVVLGTSNQNDISQRYVVLRKVDQNLNLYIYTDLRSEKVKQIKHNPQVSLLCYHPQKRVQVRIKGEAELHYQNELSKELWRHVQGDAKKAYNSKLAPGTIIQAPEEAHSWPEDLTNPENFCVIKIKPNNIEVLQLNGLHHIRIQFSKIEDQWQGQWLVP